MANVTANKSGNPVMFKSIDEAPIRSLKAHFAHVQAGSGDPSPSNVRPITGWTGMEYGVGNTPVGVFPIDFQPQDIGGATLKYLGDSTFYIDGTVATSAAVPFSIDSFTLKSGHVYYILMNSPNNFSLANTNGFIFAARNGSANKITVKVAKDAFLNSLSVILSTPWNGSDTQIDHFVIGAVAGESNIKIKISIYEESAIHNGTVNWESADTVYGGYVDLVSGEVVRNTNYRVLNGTDDSTSSQYTNYGNYSPLGFGDTFGAGRRFTVNVDNAIDSIICDSLPIYTDTTSENFPYLYVMQQGNFIYYMVIMGKPSEHPEITNVITAIQYTSNWLKEHPVTVVWKSATTTVTTLTPTQLSTFRGDNTIWSSANGTVEVEYDLHEAGDIAAIRRRVNQSAPHLITSTPADIATFNTDLAASIKELRCEFLPVQEGSGDPSPTNVRAITGWTGVDVWRWKQEIPITPINFTQASFGGATLKYLNDGSFFVDGEVSGFSTVDIPIVSFNFDANKRYAFIDNVISYDAMKTLMVSFLPAEGSGNISTSFNTYDTCGKHARHNTITGTEVSHVVEKVRFGAFAGLENLKFKMQLFEVEPDDAAIPISWQSEAGTVYGGYVDLVKGEVVAEYESKTYDSSTGWDYVGGFYTFDGWGMNLDSKHQVSQTIICNYLKGLQPGGISKMHLYETRLNTACTRLLIGIDLGINTSESLNNYLSQNPLQVVHKLTTPIHTPITPATLSTLKGTNNVWSSANGPVTIKYWKH